jgi:hypothetical protein
MQSIHAIVSASLTPLESRHHAPYGELTRGHVWKSYDDGLGGANSVRGENVALHSVPDVSFLNSLFALSR